MVNRKRVGRLYRLDGLQPRMRVRRRRHVARHRGPAPRPSGPGERWSMGLVHDALADGRPFRILTMVDQRSRSSLLLGGVENIWIHGWRGVGSGSRERLEDRAYRRGVQLDFSRPGKLTENAFIELFNRRLRDEYLNVHQFASIGDTQAKVQAWRLGYNQRRPHGSLGNLTPSEFVAQRQVTAKAAPV